MRMKLEYFGRQSSEQPQSHFLFHISIWQ